MGQGSGTVPEFADGDVRPRRGPVGGPAFPGVPVHDAGVVLDDSGGGQGVARAAAELVSIRRSGGVRLELRGAGFREVHGCLLYTSDAADDAPRV